MIDSIKAPTLLEVTVECTLNEMFSGCSKKISYIRTVLNKDGRTTKDVNESK